MGHFLCPQPRGLLLSHSAGPLPPCTQAVHATGLGSIWNPVCEQKNCRLLFFSLFTCFFPIAKQLQLPVGWCSGSGGCSCPQPREQNSSCVAVTPALTPQMPSQPQPAVLGALCSPFSQLPPELCCRKDGLKLWLPQEAVIPESGQKLLSKVFCVSPVSPLKPAEPLGPCWVVPVVGAQETGFGNPQCPAPLELCCQLCGQWNPSSSCRPCCAVVGSLGQLQFHPSLGSGR